MDSVIAAAQIKFTGGQDHDAPGVETVVGAVDDEGAAVDGVGALALDALLAGGVLLSGGRLLGGGSAGAAGRKAVAGAHVHAGAPVTGGQIKGTAVDLEGAAGADGVSLGVDGIGAVNDVEGAQSGVLRVFRMDAVLARGDGKGAAGNGHAVFAGHHQIVLGHYAVSRLGLDGQAAGAVEGQVGFGEDHRVDVVVVDGHVGATVGQGVFRSLRQGDKDLVGLQGVNGGGSGTLDGYAVQHQLDLVRIGGVDHDLTVLQGAGEPVDPLGGDDHLTAADGHPVGVTGSGGTAEGDVDHLTFIVAAIQVPVAEPGGTGLGDRRVHLSRCGTGGGGTVGAGGAAAEQEQAAEQHGTGARCVDMVHRILIYSVAAVVSWWQREISRFPFRSRSASMRPFSWAEAFRVRS